MSCIYSLTHSWSASFSFQLWETLRRRKYQSFTHMEKVGYIHEEKFLSKYYEGLGQYERHLPLVRDRDTIRNNHLAPFFTCIDIISICFYWIVSILQLQVWKTIKKIEESVTVTCFLGIPYLSIWLKDVQNNK